MQANLQRIRQKIIKVKIKKKKQLDQFVLNFEFVFSLNKYINLKFIYTNKGKSITQRKSIIKKIEHQVASNLTSSIDLAQQLSFKSFEKKLDETKEVKFNIIITILIIIIIIIILYKYK